MPKPKGAGLENEDAVHVVGHDVMNGGGKATLLFLAKFPLWIEIGVEVNLGRALRAAAD